MTDEKDQWLKTYYFGVKENLPSITLASLWKLWELGVRTDLVLINLLRVCSENKDSTFVSVAKACESEIAIDHRRDLIQEMVGVDLEDEVLDEIYKRSGFENQVKYPRKFKKAYPRYFRFKEFISEVFGIEECRRDEILSRALRVELPIAEDREYHRGSRFAEVEISSTKFYFEAEIEGGSNRYRREKFTYVLTTTSERSTQGERYRSKRNLEEVDPMSVNCPACRELIEWARKEYADVSKR
jgi:hypothetical protein